jgi:hypothetical protein
MALLPYVVESMRDREYAHSRGLLLPTNPMCIAYDDMRFGG